MEKNNEDQETEKIRKRKAFQEELISAKKGKTELQVTTQKLVGSADKKAKEAEKRTHVTTVKALLVESKCIMKKISRSWRKKSQSKKKKLRKWKRNFNFPIENTN